MGTTIVGAVIDQERCTIFNVGDSRAYWIHDAGINQISEDDVYPGERTGILTQCLGGGNPMAPKPHLIQQDIRSGDILALVSDGITDATDAFYLTSGRGFSTQKCLNLVKAHVYQLYARFRQIFHGILAH